MSKLPSNRAAQKQIQKMALAENRFDVPSKNVKSQRAPQEMPRIAKEQRRGDELPGVSIVNAAITQGQVIANKAGLKCIEEELSHETGDVQPDQDQQNDASALPPRPRK